MNTFVEHFPLVTAFLTALGGFFATLFAFWKFMLQHGESLRRAMLEDNQELRVSLLALKKEVHELEVREDKRRIERMKLRRIIALMRDALEEHDIKVVLSADLERLMHDDETPE